MSAFAFWGTPREFIEMLWNELRRALGRKP